jgi:hypothetical protein
MLESRTIRILPIPKQSDKALEGSLEAQGYSRYPGTYYALTPAKRANGKYLNGLDEEAEEIFFIIDEKDRKKEQKRISELRAFLQQRTGTDLTPTSDYYLKISHSGGLRIDEAGITLNIGDPKDYVTYLWISKHPKVARSINSITDPDMEFYIHDELAESEQRFSLKEKTNKAILKLEELSNEKRLKVAKMLGLGVDELSKEALVYNVLDDYIKGSRTRNGALPVDEFNRVINLSDELLELKVLVKDVFDLNVLRQVSGVVKMGENIVAKSVDELENMLLASKHQELLVSLRESVRQKKELRITSRNR